MLLRGKKNGQELTIDLDSLEGLVPDSQSSAQQQNTPQTPFHYTAPTFPLGGGEPDRVGQLESTVEQLTQVLATLIQGQDGADQQSQTPAQAQRSFYDDLAEFGEDAIYRSPRFTQQVGGMIQGAVAQQQAASALAQQYPGLYDPQNQLGQTRAAIRQQLGQAIPAEVLNSRTFEELVGRAAIGMHPELVVKAQTQSPAPAFMEGGSNNGSALPGGQDLGLTPDQLRTANELRVSPDAYAKSLATLRKMGVIA